MSRTISNAEKAIHMQTAPRTFLKRDLPRTTDVSRAQLATMLEDSERLTKADAVRLAQTLLVHVYSDGIGYEDFQSAQACEKYIGQAIRALRGLALS